jgi:hypothetical protein|tara:strand:- start:2050 stop:3459 length:1410 start_codon:yes stop_codon:yes gene_type:complete
MALSTPKGISSGSEDLRRQSPRIHFKPLMRYLKVILVGTCGLGLLWMLMVWLLAPEEFTNNYLPQILQNSLGENNVEKVTEKKKANAPTTLLSKKLTGATGITVESPEDKTSSGLDTDLAESIESSRKTPNRIEERNSSFEKAVAGSFEQLQTPLGMWKAEPVENPFLPVLINDKQAKTGKHCLQLTGGKKSTVILEVAGNSTMPEQLTFWAERWTSRAPFTFRIKADSGKGWQEIYNGDKKIRVGRSFLTHVKVPLSTGVKRLQFSCTSPQNTGIIIDDLRIAHSLPAKIRNEPNAKSTKPQEPPLDLEDRATLGRILANAIDEREMKASTVKGKKKLMQNDKPFTGWAKRMRGNSREVEELGQYRDGLKNGPWAKWFSGKRFHELGLFHQGQRHGLYVTWYGSGKKKDAINYENDLEHGPIATWYGSGKKWKKGNHKHGEKDGLWVTYDGRGKERNRQRYENGNPLD